MTDDHLCQRCGKWGSFGYGFPHNTIWRCGDHRYSAEDCAGLTPKKSPSNAKPSPPEARPALVSIVQLALNL